MANRNRLWVPRTQWNINIALWQLESKGLFPALCLIIEVTCGGSRRWCQAWMRLSMMPSPNNPASTVSVTTKDTLRKTEHWMKTHEKYYLTLKLYFARRVNVKHFAYKLYLCGMSFGTSISRDFMWRILMLPSIPLAVTTSQASSYIVFDSSQAYTSAAPAFLAHMLNTEKKEIRTTIPTR